MNRADRLLSVLKDGREHSRQDVYQAVGFLMTNNAAAELRQRGLNVIHRRKNSLDLYRLAGSLAETADPPDLSAVSASEPSSNPHPSTIRADADAPGLRDGDGQLPLIFVASGQLRLSEEAA